MSLHWPWASQHDRDVDEHDDSIEAVEHAWERRERIESRGPACEFYPAPWPTGASYLLDPTGFVEGGRI